MELGKRGRAVAMSSRVPPWVAELAADHQVGRQGPVPGSVSLVDEPARRRAFAATSSHELISLARELRLGGDLDNADGSLQVRWKGNGAVSISSDELRVKPHGLTNTHLDAVSHFQVDDSLFGRRDVDSASAARWAGGILTRAVFLDVALVRGTPFIDPMAPVTSADLDAALELAGAEIEPGDAIVVYMGRDAYEAAGHSVLPLSSCPPGRPGVGEDGARWISRQPVSVLCWDFVDAYVGGDRTAYVHLLIWAMGLALVDNCDLRAVRGALGDRPVKTAMLVVSPLRIPRATASLVNPLLVT
jgi:kynurenine formamidase